VQRDTPPIFWKVQIGLNIDLLWDGGSVVEHSPSEQEVDPGFSNGGEGKRGRWEHSPSDQEIAGSGLAQGRI